MKTPLTLVLTAALSLAACSSESQSTLPEGETGAAGAAETGAAETGAAETAAAETAASAEEAMTDSPDALPDGSLYAQTVNSLAGDQVDLSAYAGKVTLIVNVASACGYTRQYEGLQKLHEELGGDKFALLAFPSNDFGGQEPGSPEEIQAFCSDEFGVTFDMFEKVPVKAMTSVFIKPGVRHRAVGKIKTLVIPMA